jgi:calcineurin-like phosphoesterase family protein
LAATDARSSCATTRSGEWEGYHAGDIHFHGHTHDRLPSSRRSWDAGVDHQAFRPMTYDAIVERMSALPDVE